MKIIKLTRYKSQYKNSTRTVIPKGHIHIVVDKIEAIEVGDTIGEPGSIVWYGGTHRVVIETPEEIIAKVYEALSSDS